MGLWRAESGAEVESGRMALEVRGRMRRRGEGRGRSGGGIVVVGAGLVESFRRCRDASGCGSGQDPTIDCIARAGFW